MTDTRYFSYGELRKWIENETLVDDISKRKALGVSPISDILHYQEKVKTANKTPNEVNAIITMCEKLELENYVMIIGLSTESICEKINLEEFTDTYLDKKTNPLELIRFFCIKENDFCYWDCQVYADAIKFTYD